MLISHETLRWLVCELCGPKPIGLFDMLIGGVPVEIDTLFEALNSTPGTYDQRMKTLRLNAYARTLNGCLVPRGLRVVTGEPRGTYRIRDTRP